MVAVEDALAMLEREPQAGHELRSRLRGLRSLHVGAYQLIDDDRAVRVAAIRHRAVAYHKDPR
ncbi:MAG: type II toxin-antitoxin system RelE/ParE family toxin [Solirubrobacteraceae bacterium]